MLAVVNRPLIRIEAPIIPRKLVSFLRLNYGEVKITSSGDFAESAPDDAAMRVEDMDWYKEEAAKMTPGYNLRIFRKMRNMTQQELAGKLGISKQQISNMETGRSPIGKKMSMRLGKALNRPYKNFL
jgi:DNA-binding XRE family transcriptional regulator